MKLFEVHVYRHSDGGVERLLGEILAEIKKGRSIVADIRQDVKDVIAKFDAATTAVSDRIDRLIANPIPPTT